MAVALLLAVTSVVQALRYDYPEPGTTARERLLARNPALAEGRPLHWSSNVRRHARLTRTTVAVVGFALLLVTLRPRTNVATGTGTDRPN
jgi:peptidoglycan/LPS O-acetylase OafA/YrhL